MKVLFVAAEVSPLIKTGGLADVAGALPAALRQLGHDVRIIMPRFRQLRERGVPHTGPVATAFLPVGEHQEELRVWQTAIGETPVYMLDIPAAFERPVIYGDPDDDRRFILFARGVLNLMLHLRDVEGWNVDLVHTNDWHSALVPNYIKTFYSYSFGHVASVFTIHNLAYQGQFAPSALILAGLAEQGLIESDMGLGVAGSFNFMARAIRYSDIVSTVSPTYAQEILTSEYGERLDGLLRTRQDRLRGILNGIDTAAFDPATDPYLAANYSSDDLAGKIVCKAALQRELGLEESAERPLLGIVSRLAEMKGLDLLDASIDWLIEQTDAQLVVLGAGSPALELAFSNHARINPSRIAVRIGFDAGLAQRIYAGSDAFLMPSRFEPCGLGQMIALRYGSVPIVRATGGLNDTIHEGFTGNGFVFHLHTVGHLIEAIERCLTAYRDTTGWPILRARGMRENNSWSSAALQYSAMYEWALRTIGR
jgi:starch synthase